MADLTLLREILIRSLAQSRDNHIPISYLVLNIVVMAIGQEYEMSIYAGPLTYLSSTLITFITSMLVGILVIRKNKRISMVEALKDIE